MLLELKNIHKYYENGAGEKQHVLNDVSLAIDSGDTLAIIGPSGSGKSTLLNIMGALDKPVSGNVLFNGSEIYSLEEQELARIRNQHIGFVFQKHYLLPQLNLMENVLVPAIPLKDKVKQKQAKSRAETLLEMVGLVDKQKQLPSQLS
jgi:ABC-type lipoprotein export system ATPase subunit